MRCVKTGFLELTNFGLDAEKLKTSPVITFLFCSALLSVHPVESSLKNMPLHCDVKIFALTYHILVTSIAIVGFGRDNSIVLEICLQPQKSPFQQKKTNQNHHGCKLKTESVFVSS